jgi:membrane protease YdiL (CAAX protease family)
MPGMRSLLNPGVLIFVVAYAASFGWLSRNPAFQPGDALVELALFVFILPGIAWFSTRRSTLLPVRASGRGPEMLLVLCSLIALAIYLVNGPPAVDNLLPVQWRESQQIHFFVSLIKKLVVFVLFPFAGFRFFFGYHWRDFGLNSAALKELFRTHLPVVLSVSAAILTFQYFFGGAVASLREGTFHASQLLVALPLCFVWLALEAGLVEEFFFRAVVQTRLAAWAKSESAGVALMCLLFGLAHAPGFIFRHAGEVEGLGLAPSALDAMAYSIVVLAPAAIVFGVVWARTRNLFAVILIHAATDLLPNVGSFIGTWNLGR